MALYNGSIVRNTAPWADSGGIYFVVSKSMIDCAKLNTSDVRSALPIKLGFASGVSSANGLARRMSNYATAWIQFYILGIIEYKSHNDATKAEAEAKSYLETALDIFPEKHVSGPPNVYWMKK